MPEESGVALAGRFLIPALAAPRHGPSTLTLSLDLGLTAEEVAATPEGLAIRNSQILPWDAVDDIIASGDSCFAVDNGAPRKIHAFSEEFQRVYSLMATEGAPTLINAGFTMHRIVGIEPWQDTARKIRAIAPIRGRVLDTTTGLGYTAIQASETAVEVVTVELDPVVLEVARLNPWSRPLFDTPRIVQVIGDVFDRIRSLDDAAFSAIIHDPPTLSLAGDLYSEPFYREAYRVLKPRGRMFHYVGNPNSKHGGKLTRGVVRRLTEAGFARVMPKPDAFGFVAYKA